jgi:hypothetical protein
MGGDYAMDGDCVINGEYYVIGGEYYVMSGEY